MSFVFENMNVIAYANGFTLWSYVSADIPADICSKNYFAAADGDLKSGDMILFSHKSASFSSGALLIVAKVEKNQVTVTRLCASAEKQT